MNLKHLLYIIALVLLTGCSNTAEPAYPGKVLDEPSISDAGEVSHSAADQDDIIRGFYNLLMDNSEEETIIKFVDDNINKLDEDNSDNMILELEDHLLRVSNNITHTYEIANKYIDYVSNEVKSYIELLRLEGDNIYSDGESLKIDVKELLDRALLAERHMKEYTLGKTKKRVNVLYEAYIYGAVCGTGNQYIYAKDGSSIIKDEVLKVYNEIIDKDHSSYTAKILEQYIDELNKDNNDLNGDNVIFFYDNLNVIIRSTFK